MKKTRTLGALMLSGLLLAGCGTQEVSKEVSTSCSVDLGMMDMSFVLYAPGEDKEINKIDMNYTFSLDQLASLTGEDSIDSAQMKEAMEEYSDTMKETIADQLGIEPSDVTVSTTDDTLEMSVALNDLSKFAEQMGTDFNPDDMIYKDVVKTLEDDEFACE